PRNRDAWRRIEEPPEGCAVPRGQRSEGRGLEQRGQVRLDAADDCPGLSSRKLQTIVRNGGSDSTRHAGGGSSDSYQREAVRDQKLGLGASAGEEETMSRPRRPPGAERGEGEIGGWTW